MNLRCTKTQEPIIMKKAITILLALFTTALLFTGCGSLSGKGQEQSFKVYSFSGENDTYQLQLKMTEITTK